MIQITLGKQRAVDPTGDPLGRSQVGWSPGLSPQELFDIARGTWKMSQTRAAQERYAVVNGDGIVRLVFEIDAIVDAPGGRLTFEGRVLEPGHSVHDHYVDKPAPKGKQQNPVTYFDSPFGGRECGCGCGQSISSGTFLPGHDQRAIHERIAKVGSVKEFLDWFDATWKEAPSEK